MIGATGAFGQFICKKMLDCGLDVIAVGRNRAPLERMAENLQGMHICCTDISSDDAIEEISSSITGNVKAIVHGPGVGVAGGILDADITVLNEAVNIKVGGLLRVVRAAEQHMTRGSRIIAIGGHYGFEPTAYAASAGVANAALVNATRQLSLGLGPRGITAHVIAPGPAITDRLRKVATTRAEREGISTEDVLKQMQAESSIGAFTTPEQVAWAVSMLLDDHADAMTGSTMMLDSGRRRGLP
ncbi:MULTISPECIES: SDR family NAD(P)-dependent oxidoreductase [Marinobacter]|uniref:SDR family NAD(P)-dependent oxidoreductase n=1 Tax=Marinobacter TaxID=2742 RepID=UPI0021E6CCFD|nr:MULTISPECIES: SDR family oxidoreductase [Marinobacter]